MIDPDGIHRAVLNIVTNAIDASEGARERPGRRQDRVGRRDARSPASPSATTASASTRPTSPRSFRSSPRPRAPAAPGLGLPVSQKIVREHGGKIIVTSRPGHGATFMIELPMTRRSDPKGTSEGPTMVE